MNTIVVGHVLLNEFWQAEMGDFSLDQKRFPTMKETINIIHRRGFRIVVTIQPFISTESRNFATAVKEGILVSRVLNIVSYTQKRNEIISFTI